MPPVLCVTIWLLQVLVFSAAETLALLTMIAPQIPAMEETASAAMETAMEPLAH